MKISQILEGKFYKHDVKQARARKAERRKQANNDVVEQQILYLQDIVKRGLPDVYKSFEDFMYDFYPNFNWDDKGLDQMKAVLQDKRFPAINKAIKREWNFDLEKDLQKAIEEK